VTIVTGAGVSAASGVPTFRGAGGLWRDHRAEDLATPGAFARDPQLVWEWYAWRREQVAACQPNVAHHVIARWSASGPAAIATTVVTQNVDDLHVRAGTRDLVRLHGSIWELSCWDGCADGARWRDESVPLTTVPPRCPQCGGLARPGVVWFGEPLDAAAVNAAADATDCDVFVTIGTSSIVYPAAALVWQARQRGAFTAEINLDATPASAVVDITIREPAELALPEIDARL
jgi:NAD-dependent deacetylase